MAVNFHFKTGGRRVISEGLSTLRCGIDQERGGWLAGEGQGSEDCGAGGSSHLGMNLTESGWFCC